jgi:hypothetical protein
MLRNLLKRLTRKLRRNQVSDLFNPRGRYIVEHFRNGRKIGQYEMPNGITNVGKNHILGVEFHADTQITTWYFGLIDLDSFTALAAGDTAASHTGWVEFTDYSEANRQTWVPGAPSGQAITNGTPATFTISATGTVKGIFVISNNTISGTTGTLWATALFSADVPVSAADELKITYTVSA